MPKPPLPNNDSTTDKAGNPEAEIAKGVTGLDVGLRLVGAVLGLGALGFALDKWLGSLPWGMLGGIVLGFVAWLLSVVRRSRASTK